MLIESHKDGVVLTIHAFPGARRNEVRCAENGVKVYVTQIPEKGKANKAILKQLAQSLKIKPSLLELLQGATSPQKKVLFRNISEEEVLARFSEYTEYAPRN